MLEFAEPFLDNIGIKGLHDKDESKAKPGIQKFVLDHLERVEMVLQDLVKARLTLSVEKSYFAMREVVVVGHLCNAEGQLPEASKVAAIGQWKPCTMLTKV